MNTNGVQQSDATPTQAPEVIAGDSTPKRDCDPTNESEEPVEDAEPVPRETRKVCTASSALLCADRCCRRGCALELDVL